MTKLELDAVIFLTPTFLTYYPLHPGVDATFIYPPRTVLYQDVVDDKTLTVNLQNFLRENNFHPGKVLILLANSIVYHDTEELIDQSLLNTAMQEFYNYVPVAEDVMAKHVFVYEKITHFIAFDKRLLLVIKSILENVSWQITLVSPVVLFNYGEGDQLTKEAVQAILANEVLLSKSNLPFTTQIDNYTHHVPMYSQPAKTEPTLEALESTGEKHGKVDSKQIAMLGVCLLIFYGVASYAVINSGLIGSPAPRKVASINEHRPAVVTQPSVVRQPTAIVQPTTNNVAIPTQTPTIVFKTKSNLSIQINSANPSSADSTKAKSLLEQNGFSNITTNTGQTDGNTGLKILIGKDVSPVIRNELLTLVSNAFSNIQQVDAPREATVDLIIYTQ